MSEPALEDDRPRRRDRACLFAGAPANLVALTLIGVIAGGIAGKLLAYHISADEWDPRFNQRPHVGTNSPDDDVTKSSPTARP